MQLTWCSTSGPCDPHPEDAVDGAAQETVREQTHPSDVLRGH